VKKRFYMSIGAAFVALAVVGMIYLFWNDQQTHTERVIVTFVRTDDGLYTECRCVDHMMPAGGMWGIYGKVGDTLVVNIRTSSHRIAQ